MEELRSVSLRMDTPESSARSSHAPQLRITAPRARRDDGDVGGGATNGAQCGARSKEESRRKETEVRQKDDRRKTTTRKDSVNGSELRILDEVSTELDYDNGLSGMPKLMREGVVSCSYAESDAESENADRKSSFADRRSIGVYRVLAPTDNRTTTSGGKEVRRLQFSSDQKTPVNVESRQLLSKSPTVDFTQEMSVLNDEIKRLELRLNEQVNSSSDRERISQPKRRLIDRRVDDFDKSVDLFDTRSDVKRRSNVDYPNIDSRCIDGSNRLSLPTAGMKDYRRSSHRRDRPLDEFDKSSDSESSSSAPRHRRNKNHQRNDRLKLERYDGSTPLEAFRVQFETCCEYNRWGEFDKLAQLKASLRGSAAQVLLGDGEPLTYEQLWTDLRQNFGTAGHEAQFESQLRVRRRQKGESLRSLYQDISRLTLQAYPDSRGKLRDKLSVEAFIVGLSDNELALQVRNTCPIDLQAAYRTALMIESNRLLVGQAEEVRDRRKDGRTDMTARSVAEENELLQRVRRLEERCSESKSAPPTKTENVRNAAGIDDKIAQLERELEKLRNSSISDRVRPQSYIADSDRMMQSQGPKQSAGQADETHRWANAIGSYGRAAESSSGAEAQVGVSTPNHYSLNPFQYSREAAYSDGIICYLCDIRGHKKFAFPQRPFRHCHQFGHTIRQCPAFEPHRRNNLCFSCGGTGHYSRNCRQVGVPTREAGGGSFAAMKLACATKTRADEHRVYLELKIDGVTRSFLLDSGCDTTMMPLRFVQGYPIRPTTKKVHAANGTPIELAGEVTVDITLGSLRISTVALVSEHVSEGMIGYDWLSENDCYWGFKVGQVMIQNQIFPMTSGAPSSACCRVVVQDRIVVPRCSETIMMSKAVFSGVQMEQMKQPIELVSEPQKLENGLYVARALIPHRCTDIPIRVLNPTNRAVTLKENSTLAALELVYVVEPEGNTDGRQEDDEWKRKLIEGVDTELTDGDRSELRNILEDYSDCFSKNEFDLGRTTLAKHRIDTGGHPPIRQALRRQPLAHLNEIDRQLNDMLRQGIVEPSASPWSSNIVIVAKKDGSLRFCVDYRGLNKVTRKDSYPLPRISDCLDALGSATYFSTFDLRSGYFQIGMDEADRDKTSFVTRRGTFRFTAMPFGLTNAPAIFQRVMDVAMSGLNYEICLVYLDDIILFSKTIAEHFVRLRQIFDRLRSANLKLKPSKCHLLRRTVTFLGHVITENGIATDPEKIESVESWPVPRNLTELRSFLGLSSYYRRFVKNFALIAAPLHALTGKGIRFQWTSACQAAFDELKVRLTSSPVLAMPTDDGEYRLDTDASNNSIGAVLSQVQNDEERVIAYASRLLSSAEKNYCVTRRELLAVVFFTKYFRPYLLGHEFTIRTDHSALKWLKDTPEPIGQQARWLERLEEFNYRVEHRPGSKHGNADAMSRKPCRQCHREDPLDVVPSVNTESVSVNEREGPMSLNICFGVDTGNTGGVEIRSVHFDEPQDGSDWKHERIKAAYENDPEVGEIHRLLSDSQERVPWEAVVGKDRHTKAYWQQWERLRLFDGILYRQWKSLDGSHAGYQLIPPVKVRDRLLEIAHTGRTGGHLGMRRTKEQLQRRAYWVGWTNDVERYCERCAECCRYHRGPPRRQGELQVTAVGEPFERVAIDLTGPHPVSRSSNIYILTVVDLFSKWAEAVPLRNKEAVTVARALSDVVLSRYGLPMQLLSDNGKEFDNCLMSELCRLLEIEKLRTTAYKASTNGGVERFHRTLNAMIAKVVAENQRNWDEMLPSVMAAYRSSRHEATGFTPNYLMFGREVRAPIDLLFGVPTEDTEQYDSYEAFVSEKAERMRNAYKLAREQLGQGAERMKKYYDMRVKPAVFKRNTWVYYYSPRRFIGKSPKWQKFYSGPYLIVRTFGAVNVVLQQNRKSKPFAAHIDKLKLCYGPTPNSWLADDDDETQMKSTFPPAEEAPPDVEALFAIPDEEANQRTTADRLIDGVAIDETEVKQPECSHPSDRPRRTIIRPRHLNDFC